MDYSIQGAFGIFKLLLEVNLWKPGEGVGWSLDDLLGCIQTPAPCSPNLGHCGMLRLALAILQAQIQAALLGSLQLTASNGMSDPFAAQASWPA